MTKTQKFLERIGLSADTKIEYTYDFLKLIQYHSVLSIAYENIDLIHKKEISLKSNDLFEKIVIGGRGGYCFEVNGILSWFFTEAGFEVCDHFARFLRGESEIPMRRHRIVSVKLNDGFYMCDIGVGQTAPKYPIKIEEGLIQHQFDEQYKFEKDNNLGWVLYDFYKGEWRQFISFTEDKQYEIDFLQPSFFCQTHPESIFNKTPIIAIKTADGRKTIDDREYKIFKGENIVHIEENINDERFYELLVNDFNIKL